MSLCNATIQQLESSGYDVLTGKCPVEGCGLPVARHRDENAPPPLSQAGVKYATIEDLKKIEQLDSRVRNLEVVTASVTRSRSSTGSSDGGKPISVP